MSMGGDDRNIENGGDRPPMPQDRPPMDSSIEKERLGCDGGHSRSMVSSSVVRDRSYSVDSSAFVNLLSRKESEDESDLKLAETSYAYDEAGVPASRLKFRVIQPVDIPRCSELEKSFYPPGVAASKATLQYRQHYAAPFFRCMLFCPEKGGVTPLRAADASSSGEPKDSPHEPDHVVIGYVCATRCREFISEGEFASHKNKHESEGPLLAIFGIVIDEKYKSEERQDLKRAMLLNYIRAVEIWNGEAETASASSTKGAKAAARNASPKKRKPSKQKPGKQKQGKKRKKIKIKKIVLTTSSRAMEFYVSLGFRWRKTISTGLDPQYELDREVSSLVIDPPKSVASDVDTRFGSEDFGGRNKGQDCYLVDSFADPRRCGSGNSAAIVVLRGPPSETVVSHGADETVECIDDDELAEEMKRRAEHWMHSVAKEFSQPATAFVWRIDGGGSEDSGERTEAKKSSEENSEEYGSSQSDRGGTSNDLLGGEDCDAIGYDIDENGPHPHSAAIEKESDDAAVSLPPLRMGRSGGRKIPEVHHFIRFYTRGGVEVNMCAHATLGAASILFQRYSDVQRYLDQQDDDVEKYFEEDEIAVLVFHSRKGVLLRARRAPPHPTLPLRRVLSTPSLSSAGCSLVSPARIAMDYPWRDVRAIPPGTEGEGAVISMLRRAFFGAWSVLSPAEEREKEDGDTDELAFSCLSKNHILYMGVTVEGEDLLVELTPEGFDLLSSGRSVDYVALKQGWNGYTRGVIVCCEVPVRGGGKDEVAGGGVKDKVGGEGKSEAGGGATSEKEADDSVVLDDGGVSLDFRSRYFEPKAGVNEDPVSGWPHCALGPYFGSRSGKTRLLGMQESDRGGLVECVLKEGEGKVCIIGHTVTTVEGKLKMNF